MKTNLLTVLFFAPLITLAQIQITPLFSKNYGGNNHDQLNGFVKGTDGKYILVGSTASNTNDIPENYGFLDAWVLVLEEDGTVINSFVMNGAGTESAISIVETSLENYLVLTHSNSITGGDFPTGLGLTDIWLKPISPDGSILTGFHFGGSQHDSGEHVFKTQSGNFVLVGYTSSTDGTFSASPGGKRAFIARVNTNGALIWLKYFEEEILVNHDQFTKATELGDGKILAAGTRLTAGMGVSPQFPFLARYSSIGDLVDWKEFTNNSENQLTSLATTWGDTIWIGGKGKSSTFGFTSEVVTDEQYGFLYKVNPESLEFEQALFFTGDNSEIVSDVTTYGDSLVLVTLASNSSDGFFAGNNGGTDVFVALVNGKMEIKGIFPFGGSYADGNTDAGGMKLAVSNNEAILYGHSNSIDGHLPGNYGQQDAWVLKFNPEPLLNTLAKSDKQVVTMYPNPTQDKLTVLLPFSQGTTQIKFFNALGQTVHEVQLSQHINHIQVDHLPKGMYMVSVVNGKYKSTSKIIIH